MQRRNLEPSNKPPPGWFHRHLSKIRKRLPEGVRHRFRDLNKEPPAERTTVTFKKFDTSGKSPAYLHHRKNFRACAGKPAAGFLIWIF
jgi:hypothetical protein